MAETICRFGRGGCLVSALALSLAIACSMPATLAAVELTPAQKNLVERAKLEGRLDLSWGGSKGTKRFEAGFNAYYGTNLKFEFTPGWGKGMLAAKLDQELAAGRPAFEDIAVTGASPGIVGFYLERKLLKPVPWGPLLPHVTGDILETMVSADGSLIAFLSRIESIVYNTRYISKAEAPKRLKDLLDPKWKGKIASTPYAAGFGSLVQHKEWGEARVLSYARRLAHNLGGLMRCANYDRITVGEFWIFGIACRQDRARRLAARGAPVAEVFPRDALIVVHGYIGVPVHAPHPSAAILFIAWLLTPEGQAILYDATGSDLHYLEGSRIARVIDAESRKAGRKFEDQTLHRLLAGRSAAVQRRVARIFRETRRAQ